MQPLDGYLFNPIVSNSKEQGKMPEAFMFIDSEAEANFIGDTILQLRPQYECKGCGGTGKDLSTSADNGPSGIFAGLDDSESTDPCPDCKGRGSWGNFFVTYRVRAVGPFVERALLHRSIPFINLNGTSFWKLQHVQITWRYLQLIVALKNNDHRLETQAHGYVYRIASRWMQQPWDRKSKESGAYLDRKGEYINHRWLDNKFKAACPTYTQAELLYKADKLHWQWKAGVADYVNTISRLLATYDADGFRAAIDWIIENITTPWYMKEHGGMDEADSSFGDDLDVIRTMAEDYETAEEFLGFIDEIQKATDNRGQGANAVVLATFHKIKGQEADVVFMAGCSEMIVPTAYALGKVFPPKGMIPPPPTNDGIVNERLAFYVGFTRAKKEVYITCPLIWRKKEVEPSRFIAELGLMLQSV